MACFTPLFVGWDPSLIFLLSLPPAPLGVFPSSPIPPNRHCCHLSSSKLISLFASRPCPLSNSLVPKHSCYVTDLANKDTYMCYQVPQFACFVDRKSPPGLLDNFSLGSVSYGHLILANQQQSCLLVDVFTGVSVSAPQLPVGGYILLYYAALTAPLSSRNSHLLVNAGCHNFFWSVGSNSWLRRSPSNGTIKQVVVFKGQVFGMDHDRRLYIVHLEPQICIQKIAVDLDRSMTSKWHLSHPWPVACSDMLLMVGCRESFASTGDTFEAFRLDLSSEPAKWVKVEKLDNWAIFISVDQRSQPLCCMNPERWGGRSNCVYCYSLSKEWFTFELGKPLEGDASNPSVFFSIHCDTMMQPMWVVPSMLYSCS
ncbi:hypothetical protein CFC21_106685 [Triticum aestivum]|uniref:KIB1-4 beta-propeller domain-containing protein n=2 Tax=Triticum aestivum TaxID=4565 RepID=A0A9R1MEJ5_WHEAT|nr:uncharacterized protein LOC123168934 [Triticum aestivum]KAF7105915.1 hypothetical protein CFC21_106685 [Triticum aestivum]